MVLKTSRLCNVSKGGRQGWDLLHLVSVLCLGLLLFCTYRLYKDAYFGDDDFRNLYWVQQNSFVSMIGYLVAPISSYFRPAGMMCYWVLLRFFDLNPAAYHWLAWSFHAANTALVYFILKRLTGSGPGAAVGAMLFASEAAFAEIYGCFCTIFELVAAFFSFIGILLWTSERRGWWRVVLASLTLLLAMKGKEMAITLPLVWLSYDLLLRKDMNWRMAAHWALPGGLALWYGLTKTLAMRGVASESLTVLLLTPFTALGFVAAACFGIFGWLQVTNFDPYHLSINWSTLSSGFGYYLNMLFSTNFRWEIWFVSIVALLLVLALSRQRLALFFGLYVFITFLPVIFLINHRFVFYWYLPFLGVCGLAAVLAKKVYSVIEMRNPRWLTQGGASAAFVLLCWVVFQVHKEANRPKMSFWKDRAHEHRALVTGLRALPPPPPGETIFFDSKPSHFDETVLLSATQVVLGRTDLRVRLVTQFPPEARYRMRFRDSHLVRVSQ